MLIGESKDESLELHYIAALTRLGIEIEHFQIDRILSLPETSGLFFRLIRRLANILAVKLIARRFLMTIRQNKYHAIIVFKGMPLSFRTIEMAKNISKSSVWVNINPDDPFNIGSKGSTNKNVMKSVPLFDLYVTWSEILAKKINKVSSGRVEVIPFAYSIDSHREHIINLEEKIDISFIGGWDPSRERLLETAAQFNLKIYGDGWQRIRKNSPLRKFIIPRNISGDDYSRIVKSSKVSVNILRPQNYGSHNMRTFEIPAMGGVMLTTRSNEQQKFFPDGRCSMMFDGDDEFIKKIQLLLSSKLLRNQIRLNAIKASRYHSYDSRAKNLVKFISEAFCAK